MKLQKTRLHILENSRDLSSEARSGVSLHCHTEHSKEMLDFVPHYAEKLPIIATFWRKERDDWKKKTGRQLDFSTAYWSPPLTEDDVFGIERTQIENAGLNPIVSISDHDSIDANMRLNEKHPNAVTPISLEWTVPYEYGYFHVGVHNLPKDSAIDITKTLLEFTFADEKPNKERLRELLTMLNDIPNLLIVLNHPLWDIERVGNERHRELLKGFLNDFLPWIHAFEINGFRAWSENKEVIEMGEALDVPIVTGGDRHGCKPNTVVNMSNCSCFDEFVEEIRVDKHSNVVLMPEYRAPLHSRQLQSFSEILKEYPEFREGRRKWFDRVYFDIDDGHGVRQLSVHWKRGGPKWLRWAIWTLGVLGDPKLRPAFALFRRSRDVVPTSVDNAEFKISAKEDFLPALEEKTIS